MYARCKRCNKCIYLCQSTLEIMLCVPIDEDYKFCQKCKKLNLVKTKEITKQNKEVKQCDPSTNR